MLHMKMKMLSSLLALCEENPPMSDGSPHKGFLMQSFLFYFLWASTSILTNSYVVGDVRCYNPHVKSLEWS